MRASGAAALMRKGRWRNEEGQVHFRMDADVTRKKSAARPRRRRPGRRRLGLGERPGRRRLGLGERPGWGLGIVYIEYFFIVFTWGWEKGNRSLAHDAHARRRLLLRVGLGLTNTGR